MNIPKKCAEVQVTWLDGDRHTFPLSSPCKIEEFEDCYEFMANEGSERGSGSGTSDTGSSMVAIQKSEIKYIRFVEVVV